jgi:hypothetical protein
MSKRLRAGGHVKEMTNEEESRALLGDFRENTSSLDRSRFTSLEISSIGHEEDDIFPSILDPERTIASINNTLIYLPSPSSLNLKSPSMEKVMYEMDPKPIHELYKLFELAYPMVKCLLKISFSLLSMYELTTVYIFDILIYMIDHYVCIRISSWFFEYYDNWTY